MSDVNSEATYYTAESVRARRLNALAVTVFAVCGLVVVDAGIGAVADSEQALPVTEAVLGFAGDVREALSLFGRQ